MIHGRIIEEANGYRVPCLPSIEEGRGGVGMGW
jgi:hypothetical protein